MMVSVLMMIALSDGALVEPPPDPPQAPSTVGVVVSAVAVGAASCVGSMAGNAFALQTGASFPPTIAAGPVLGVAGAGVGGGLAQSLVDEPDPAVGAAWAAGGALVVGAGAAAVGFAWGYATSDDAPLLAAGFGALGLGALGMAVGGEP